MNIPHRRLGRLLRVVSMLSAISLMTACSAFMHGFTHDQYEGYWWPVEPTRIATSPSGMERLNLEMDFDPTIKAHVTINGFPDYIYVGSDELTELAYFETDTIYRFKRSTFGVESDVIGTSPIHDARADLAGNRPMSGSVATQRLSNAIEPTTIVDETVPITSTSQDIDTEPPETGELRGPVNSSTSAPASAGGDFGRYYALVIGNKKYDFISSLKTPHADADAVGALLRNKYGFQVEIQKDVKRYDIIKLLSDYRHKLTRKDNLLIYYAGHGIIDSDTEKGYWLPVDAEEDIPANWISNDDIAGALKAMKAKHVLVVADSCYSGTLTRNSVRSYSTQRGSDEWVKRMAAKRSRTALTSGSLEPVVDGGGGAHSVFAKAFISALKENRHAKDMDSLFEIVKRKVVLDAEQTPVYADIRFANHEGGDFVFVPR